jgi:hypothetical protein
LAHGGALGGGGASLAKAGFDLVEFLDGGERTGGEPLADFEGFMELAPGVRPAGGQIDAILVGRPRWVGGIGVGLEATLIVFEQFVEAGGFAAGVPLIEDVALDAVARGVDDPEVEVLPLPGSRYLTGVSSAWRLPV